MCVCARAPKFYIFLFMYVHVYHTTCLPMCVRVHMCKRHTQHLCASGILFVHVCVIVGKGNLEEGKLVCGLPAQYSPVAYRHIQMLRS